MQSIELNVNGQGVWPDLHDTPSVMLSETPIKIACLPSVRRSGVPVVAIRLDLPDGQIVIAQTSLPVFQQAAKTIEAAHGIFGGVEVIEGGQDAG